jgi:hypothetical protein
MTEFRCLDDVDKWVEEHGIAALESALINNGFSEWDIPFATAWLEREQQREALTTIRTLAANDFQAGNPWQHNMFALMSFLIALVALAVSIVK